MIDNHFQLVSSELDPIFQFAKDCFGRSYERFTGDVNEFNRNGNNDLFISKYELGHLYAWKTGVMNKMIRDLQKKVTIPVDEFAILQTPAHGTYQWHLEGTEYTEHSTEQFRHIVSMTRRSVALNYPLDNADLSNSRIEWATSSDKLKELLIDGYSNIMNSVAHEPTAGVDIELLSHNFADDHINLRLKNTTFHIGKLQHPNISEALKLTPKEINDILTASHDTGEGLSVKAILSNVYDNHDELLLTKVDEYYDMTVPTLIKTNQWHRVDNSHVDEDRNMGSISFNPEYSYSDIKKLIMNNEFIK